MPYIITTRSNRKYSQPKRLHYLFNEENDSHNPNDLCESDLKKDQIPWISEEFLSKSYVITIRPMRYSNFRARMGNWANEVEKVNGINGYNLNLNRLYESKQISSLFMKRGRIGCFLSHRNVWKDIIDNKHKIGFILEDDVNLVYCKFHEEKLRNTFETLSATTDNWDLAYLCYYPRGKTTSVSSDPENKLRSNFVQTCSWHVLFGYAITLQGAEILYKHSLPITTAVDVYIGNMATRMRIKAIRRNSAICTVKFNGSDTEGIL